MCDFAFCGSRPHIWISICPVWYAKPTLNKQFFQVLFDFCLSLASACECRTNYEIGQVLNTDCLMWSIYSAILVSGAKNRMTDDDCGLTNSISLSFYEHNIIMMTPNWRCCLFACQRIIHSSMTVGFSICILSQHFDISQRSLFIHTTCAFGMLGYMWLFCTRRLSRILNS